MTKRGIIFFVMLLAAYAARAFDFSAATTAGQMVYYSIMDGTTVKVVNPDWDNYTQPTGFLTLSSFVQHNGISYQLVAIDAQAFRGCGALTGVSVPEGVTSIGRMAFAFCSSLDSIVLPSTLREIGSMAFTGTAYYSSSTHLTPEGLMVVGSYIIAALSSIADPIVVPEGILGLGNMAFYSCSQLSQITLPSSLRFIGENAFASCTALDSITLFASVPPLLESNSFTDVPTGFVVAVPCGAGAAYRAADNWSALTIVEMCNGINNVNEMPFSATATEGGLYITLPDGYNCMVSDMLGRPVATLRTSGFVPLKSKGIYFVSSPSLGKSMKVIFSR